jgi:crossover junction endodeoxyribonuclease RusA
MRFGVGKEKLIVALPYPPSVNRALRTTRQGKIYLHDSVKRYRASVGVLTIALPRLGKAKLCVEVNMYPPDKRRRDIDNILKSLLDALQHAGVYENDYQIVKLTVERCGVREGGMVEVKIAEYRQ